MQQVGVLVQGRAVGDLVILPHVHRAPGDALEEPGVFGGQLALGPHDRGAGGQAEAQIDPRGDAGPVVVAPDQRQRRQLPDQVQGFIGVGSIAHQVAQDHVALDRPPPGVAHHRAQRLDIGVDVRKDEVHG